jgi:transposase
LRRQLKRAGLMDRVELVWGTPRRLLAEHREPLRNWLSEARDLTLQQLQQKLLTVRGITISLAQIDRALKKLDLGLKKSHSTPQNGTAKKTSSGARSLPPAAQRSRRTN